MISQNLFEEFNSYLFYHEKFCRKQKTRGEKYAISLDPKFI